MLAETSSTVYSVGYIFGVLVVALLFGFLGGKLTEGGGYPFWVGFLIGFFCGCIGLVINIVLYSTGKNRVRSGLDLHRLADGEVGRVEVLLVPEQGADRLADQRQPCRFLAEPAQRPESHGHFEAKPASCHDYPSSPGAGRMIGHADVADSTCMVGWTMLNLSCSSCAMSRTIVLHSLSILSSTSTWPDMA